MKTEFIKISLENYKLIYNKIRYYTKYDYNNGMANALSRIQKDEIDRLVSENEEDSTSDLVEIRRICVEDAVENVEYMVESTIRYNKVADKQWLREIKPLIR